MRRSRPVIVAIGCQGTFLPVVSHPFLSDPWIAAAREIHEEYRGHRAPLPYQVRMNLVVNEVPFGPGTLDAHVDTASGELEIDLGHLGDADVTLTLDYETAKALLVEQNPQAGMQAYLGGHVKVQGDVSKLLVLQGQLATPDPTATEATGRIRDITS